MSPSRDVDRRRREFYAAAKARRKEAQAGAKHVADTPERPLSEPYEPKHRRPG